MKRVALVGFASGLAGALLGIWFGAWAVRSELADAEPGRTPRDDETLERRVEALEHALANLEPRVHVLTTPSELDPGVARDGGESDAPEIVGGPVLGATVVDLVGKPPARDARVAHRGPRDGARYWAQELTMQLSLTPAQTERLRAIQVDLDRELIRAEAGPPEQRTATRRALQQDAERQLRAELAPRQLAAYEALDARLKLYPSSSN